MTLWTRIAAFIEAPRGSAHQRDALLFDLAAHQAEQNPVFAKLCAARGVSFATLVGPDGWPAVPTELWKHLRVSSYPEREDRRVFRTSGTTSGARGSHAFRDLTLYDLAARTAADALLFRGRAPVDLLMLAPHPNELSDSSLSYMLGRFETWFGAQTTWALEDGALRKERVIAALDRACEAGRPLAILGTSFALVHALDAVEERSWRLPRGSLVMPTGGFKGRSREIDADQMRALLSERFGLPLDSIVGEYGMTELSSQMYERGGVLEVPHWVRATPVDPERLVPVEPGEIGILRIDDLANVDSVVSVQTADLGRVGDDGRVTLLGRMPGATPRGCSLTVEEMLG
jgi:Acyl-protein synthetase, LuxE